MPVNTPLCANDMVPLYQQLMDTLHAQIAEGTFKPGDRIPSEAQLSEMYNISRITVRSALKNLVEEGVLVKKHGKGTFVAMPAYVESMHGTGGSFTESWLQSGSVPGTKLISREVLPADGRLAKKLGIETGSRMLCIKRLRLVDTLPAIFEVDYFPEGFEFLLHAQLNDTSILELIRSHTGMVLKQFADVFEVKNATREHAEHLECPKNTPLLRVSQTVLTGELTIMYYNEQYIRSDRYKYAVRSY